VADFIATADFIGRPSLRGKSPARGFVAPRPRIRFLPLLFSSNHSPMQRILSLLSAVLVGSVLFTAVATAADYSLFTHHIQWTGSMPTQTHHGLLSPTDFALSIDDSGVVQSLAVTLDMNTIHVTDLEEGRPRTKLMQHLRSEDFLQVEAHPTASFSLQHHANGLLVGTINIRGVAQPMELPVTLTRNADQSWNLRGTFTFNRQAFGVNDQNGGFFSAIKDKLIRDEVEVAVDLTVSQI